MLRGPHSPGHPTEYAYPGFPSARATDPQLLGWRVAADETDTDPRSLRFADGSFFRFPASRFSFSRIPQFCLTVALTSPGPPTPLVSQPRSDIDDIGFSPLNDPRRLTWRDAFDANYADGLIVMHQGKVIQERYAGISDASTPHIAFSVTKSFIGLLAELLIDEGELDDTQRITRYVPALADSAFASASVRQVLDMTTDLSSSEDFANPASDVYRLCRAARLLPMAENSPATIREFVAHVAPGGAHGQTFAYRTVNTDALGWILQTITGKPVESLLQERIWNVCGFANPAQMVVDAAGVAFAGGGLCLTLPDLARFGELMRCGGWIGERQVIPSRVIDRITHGGNSDAFARAKLPTLPGWRYSSMWWCSPHAGPRGGAYMARGIHGQALYIDPSAELVIARFGSHPMGSNLLIDPASLPAYAALADALRC